MNIQVINANNNINPVFSSKLVPNNTLRAAFDHAKTTGDVKFLNAIKNILNDGRNNEIKIESYRNLDLPVEDEYVRTKLFVNGKEIDCLDNYFTPPFIDEKNVSTGNRIKDSIKLIVRNLFDKSKLYRKYERDFSPVAVAYNDLVNAEFIDANKLQVTYLSGKDFIEVTEILDLDMKI